MLLTNQGEVISTEGESIEFEFDPTKHVSMDKLDIQASDDALILKFEEELIFNKTFDKKKLFSDSLSAKFNKKLGRLVINYKTS
jgi:hypothetical protein